MLTVKPGSLDVLHVGAEFDVKEWEGIWGLPTVKPARWSAWSGWPKVKPVSYDRRNAVRSAHPMLHFFTDDFRFESVWNKPWAGLKAVQRYRLVVAPDFSTYDEWPLICTIWNLYRARWVAAFWQAHGVTVIPTATWCEETLKDDLAFAGLPRYSTYVLPLPGANDDWSLYERGLFRMVKLKLTRGLVFLYGGGRASAERYLRTIHMEAPLALLPLGRYHQRLTKP